MALAYSPPFYEHINCVSIIKRIKITRLSRSEYNCIIFCFKMFFSEKIGFREYRTMVQGVLSIKHKDEGAFFAEKNNRNCLDGCRGILRTELCP